MQRIGIVLLLLAAPLFTSCGVVKMVGEMGTLYERDRILATIGSGNAPASAALFIQAMDARLRHSMPDGYGDVQIETQTDKNWMTLSSRNNTLGEEFWRLSIQFHRAPDETGPHVVARLRVVYTEDYQPENKFDVVFSDISAAMLKAASY